MPSTRQKTWGMDMASASEDRCPVCLITLDNAALTMPCLHRFCFSCIQRWAEIKPECPLSHCSTCRTWPQPGRTAAQYA
uniref:RING-type E3 ubiquitin transferase n=1 Tax=Strix occidentalis caurina TaxID=311401 RepID=A0A8D0G3S8_STROC